MSKQEEDYWDCHKHRDKLKVSKWGSYVYHPEKGVLSQGMRSWDVYINMPIPFKDDSFAYDWIKNKCIGDLQEELGTLEIGFSLVLLKAR